MPAQKPMTRNDAYKAARRAWRMWHRRGTRDFSSAIITSMHELRMQGFDGRDTRMVCLWIKAFANGCRLPTEAALRNAEQSY